MIDFATLLLNTDSRGVRTGSNDLNRLGDSADRNERRVSRSTAIMTRAFGTVGRAAFGMAATLGAAFAGGAIVREIAGFEHAMAQVAAITRATDDQLKLLRSTAMGLGATTEFSASQAADGLRFLGMAGFSAAEAVAAIPDVLNLATAASMDLATAADISSNIMSGFGIAAMEAASVADVLAAASSRANTDVNQLGTAMSYVGPVASALDISLGDTAAAVGVLSDAGIQGSMAGTGLRRILSSLVSPTDQAADAIKSMGLSLAEVSPATESITDIVERFAGANITAAEALTIFGDRGGPAILALTSQVPGLNELTTALGDVEGEALRMATTMRDTLQGDLQGLGSAIQGVVLAMGEAGLTGILRTVVQGITSVFRLIGAQMERIRAYIIAAALAVTTYFAPAIIAGAIAMGRLTAAALLTRAALIRTGIGALIVGLGEAIYFLDQMSGKLGGFSEMMRMFSEVAKEVWERFGYAAQAALYGALELWQNFKFTAYNAMQGVVDATYDGTNKMIGAFVGAKDAIIATWRAIPGAIGDLVFQAANSLIEGVESMLNAAIRRIDAFVGKIGDALAAVGIETAFGGIGEISLGGVDNPFVGQAAAVGKAASEAFTAAMDVNYTGAAPRLFGQLAADAASMQAIYSQMASSFRDLAGRPLTSVQAIVDRLRESGEAAGETEEEIRTVAEALAAVNAETDRLGGAGGGGGKGRDKASEGLPSILNGLVSPLQKLAGAAGQMQSSFADAFTDMVMGAKSATEALSGLLQMAARALINRAFANAFAFAFGAADGAVMSAGNVVPFAKGGVVGGPTAFGMSGGKTGLMGEAGPEAIMPLKRGADGKLGVASQRATERIELAITAEEGEMFTPRVRQISGNVAIQVSTQANRLQKQAFGSTLSQYDQRGTTA